MRKRRSVALVAILVLSIVTVLGVRYLQRQRASVDVRAFIPAVIEGLIFIPKVDEFTEQLIHFIRGIEEVSLVSELLKNETGVQLRDSESLRAVGIDPEAGLGLFWAQDCLYLLLGVEEPESLLSALSSKFNNLGFDVEMSTSSDSTPEYRVLGPEKRLVATYRVEESLLTVVYSDAELAPETAFNLVSSPAGQAFFDTEEGIALQKEHTASKAMFYLRIQDNSVHPWMVLPSTVPASIRGWLQSFVDAMRAGVQSVTGALHLGSCEAGLQIVLTAAQDAGPLVATGWKLESAPSTQSNVSTAVGLADLLPRDTVLFTRFEVNLRPVGELLRSFVSLTGGLQALMGGGDAVAGFLGKYVHPELSDRHVLNDLLYAADGHLGVSLLGIDDRAQVHQLIDVSDPIRWLTQVHLALSVTLRDGPSFFATWWEKRQILEGLGYTLSKPASSPSGTADTVALIQRGCNSPLSKAPHIRRKTQKKGKDGLPCEEYGVLLRGNTLLLTSGRGSLSRLLATASGEAAALPTLTRETLAKEVFGAAPLLWGGYFSFDGLLRAVENRNLPGGATRYLAQLFELAVRLRSVESNIHLELLLTR